MAQAVFVSEGGAIDHTPGSAVVAGDVIVTGNQVGVAKTAISASALGAIAVTGVFDIAKTTAAIADGADVFWDADGDPDNGTAGSGAATAYPLGPWLGTAIGAAASGADTVRVSLGQSQPEALENEILDPGDAGAIPVDKSGFCDIVTAGAETRTMAAPSYAGQQIQLNLKTDGGDAVLTIATAVNQTGNNTLTFADAGDHIILSAGTSGANLRWRVVCNDGVALSTV